MLSSRLLPLPLQTALDHCIPKTRGKSERKKCGAWKELLTVEPKSLQSLIFNYSLRNYFYVSYRLPFHFAQVIAREAPLVTILLQYIGIRFEIGRPGASRFSRLGKQKEFGSSSIFGLRSQVFSFFLSPSLSPPFIDIAIVSSFVFAFCPVTLLLF